jgi:hypothetical protein
MRYSHTSQTLVTQVELALQQVIHTAAVKTIGQKCVRRGATSMDDDRTAPSVGQPPSPTAHGYATPQKVMMRS